jgi:hypothetical protein
LAGGVYRMYLGSDNDNHVSHSKNTIHGPTT